MSHLLISASHKSSGKTTLTIGICASLAARGARVQPFKKGPDYIDPMWLGEAAGRPCHNLDFYTMGRPDILATFARYSGGADISVIEGNKGLYDGLDLDGSNSNAALAKLLGSPVVLVIDARGMTRGIAPLILGYQAFDQEIRIAGVILNQLGGSRHEEKLRAVIEHYTDVRVLGAVHRDSTLDIAERHLGLVPSNEAGEVQTRIGRIAEVVGRQIDLDAMVEIAGGAHPLPVVAMPLASPEPVPDVRIGMARDSAFGFYYPGDLEAMRAAGAEIVPFDTLRDPRLPNVDGLFIGGGFPETHMRALESNARLRADVKRFVESGRPVYAECGGLMYLARRIRWKGETREMVGALPADVVMHERPMGRGYVRLRETGKSPWPRLGSDSEASEIPGHEFHHSSLENLGEGLAFAYRVLRGAGIDGEHDGLIYKGVLASYAHLRNVGGNQWVSRFLAYVRRCKRAREGAPPQAVSLP
jgi:cobyrinic acid a,c-diamide synthase